MSAAGEPRQKVAITKSRKGMKLVRTNKKQQALLEQFYQMQTTWSKSLVENLAEKLNMPTTKVYKWNWDRRRSSKLKRAKFSKDDSQKKEVTESHLKSLF